MDGHAHVTAKTIDTQDIVLYNVSDIQRILKLGRVRAYELMNSDGFPSFKLNKKLYIEKTRLDDWVRRMTGKQYYF